MGGHDLLRYFGSSGRSTRSAPSSRTRERLLVVGQSSRDEADARGLAAACARSGTAPHRARVLDFRARPSPTAWYIGPSSIMATESPSGLLRLQLRQDVGRVAAGVHLGAVFASNAGIRCSLNSFSVEPPLPPTYSVVWAAQVPNAAASARPLMMRRHVVIGLSPEVGQKGSSPVARDPQCPWLERIVWRGRGAE